MCGQAKGRVVLKEREFQLIFFVDLPSDFHLKAAGSYRRIGDMTPVVCFLHKFY